MARVKDLWHVTAGGAKTRTTRYGKGKRWLAIWMDPGGSEVSRAFGRRIDAERHGAAQETDMARGTYVSPKDARVTVGQWCDTWIAGYGMRPRTMKLARSHIVKIKAEFGTMPLASVRPSRVKAWTARLSAEGYEASYIHALHARLAQILADAVRDKLIPGSPCSRKTSPPMGKQRPYVLTTAQLWQLHAAMPPYLQIAILLGALAGLRTAEACGLRPGDVDLVAGVIEPHVQYPAEPLKTEISQSAVPVPLSLTTELLAHMARWPGATVLADEAGGQVGPWKLERAIKGARAKVPGLPAGFRFHDLRHYLASFLINSGADVKKVQARMRHGSAQTTLDTYGHLWPDADESTRSALEGVFLGRPEQERNSERRA